MYTPNFSSATARVVLMGMAALGANAHMMMKSPVPYGVDSLNNSPLDASGADYPCKQRAGVYEVTQMNNLTAGEDNTLSFTGSAVHGGGSCQLSLTKDKEPTAKSSFKVIVSYEGGCPGVDGPSDFTYQIPKASVPDGEYTLAWTWYNRIGNREMYMNCAPIAVSGGGGASDADFAALPDVFIANVGNGCSTTETTDLQFPDPGKVVVKDPAAKLAPPVGSSCAAPTGASQVPAAEATAGTGGAGSSGGSDSSGSSGDSGSSGTSGSDNTGQCTGSCLGGGAAGGGTGAEAGAGTDAGSGSDDGAASGGAAPAASSAPVASPTEVAPSAPAAAPSEATASPSAPATPANPGGVFAPGASGAATSESASTTSTLTTLLTVTGGASSAAGAAPTSPAPVDPVTNGSSDSPAAPSAAPAAPAGTGASSATGSTCTTPGAVVCNGESQFGICNVDNTVVWQAVAQGTTCQNGQIAKRRVAYHVHGGPRRNFFGWQ